jgi:hypothetical protein
MTIGAKNPINRIARSDIAFISCIGFSSCCRVAFCRVVD